MPRTVVARRGVGTTASLSGNEEDNGTPQMEIAESVTMETIAIATLLTRRTLTVTVTVTPTLMLQNILVTKVATRRELTRHSSKSKESGDDATNALEAVER